MNDNPWRPEEVDLLITKYRMGETPTTIGKLLDRTRNSIIGKADRMGLKRPGVTERLPRARRQEPPRRRHKRSPLTRPLTGMYRGMEWKPPTNPLAGQMPLKMIMPGQCRYVANGTAGIDTLMCGEPVFKPPYCGYHYQLCYRKTCAPSGALAAVPSPSPPSMPGTAAL